MKKILIVEDDPTSLKLARLILDNAGYTIAECDSAEQAIDAIAINPPDLILLDLGLPGMQGLDLIRILKTDDATCHIPIIAATAFPNKFGKGEVIDAGAHAYVIKPIDTRTLPLQVAEILEARRQERAQ